jgi:hypothetical protein
MRPSSQPMPDTDSNISELLAIISQIEAKRAANNPNVETACPAQLTAQLLSDDEGEQRLIAYAFALSGNLARRSEERIELRAWNWKEAATATTQTVCWRCTAIQSSASLSGWLVNGIRRRTTSASISMHRKPTGRLGNVQASVCVTWR